MRTERQCLECPAGIVFAAHYQTTRLMPFDSEPYRREDVRPEGSWVLVPASDRGGRVPGAADAAG